MIEELVSVTDELEYPDVDTEFESVGTVALLVKVVEELTSVMLHELRGINGVGEVVVVKEYMNELETVELEVVTELDELNGHELRLEDVDMKVSEVLETTAEVVPMLLDVGVEKVDISELLDTTPTLEELDTLEEGIDAALEVLDAPASGVELEEVCPSDVELEEDVDATSDVVALDEVVPPNIELELEIEDV